MTDYEELVKALRGKFIAYDVTGNHNSAQLYKDAAAAIEDLQAQLPKRGEWVRIVRCKDCKHRDPADKGCDCAGHEMLMGGIIPMPDNWYCADGKRKVQE